jgi:hypothetical protein
MYYEIIVDNALTAYGATINDNRYTYLQVKHPNHGLNVGDTVVFSSILSFLQIPTTVLNTSFTISSIIDSSTYIVNLPKYSNSGSQTNKLSGTANIIKSPLRFRLLFNK